MTRGTRAMMHVHGLLLKLYPRAYRVEYGDEQRTVFHTTIDDSAQQSWPAAFRRGLRELRDLPGAAAAEHWRQRSEKGTGSERGSRLDPDPGSWREAIAALAPFLVFGALPTAAAQLRLTTALQWLEAFLALALLGLLLALLVIGIIKGVPRWFLPYLGFPLAPFSVYGVFGSFLDRRGAPLIPWGSWILRQTAYQGLLWIGLLPAAFLVTLITRLVAPWRPFHWRLRRDWTLLPFALYGTTLFALLLTFDDYAGDEPYKIAAMLLLAAGGWLYLRSARPWPRFLALFIGLTSAMAVAAAGKAILYSSPSWPGPRHFTWQTEAMGTVIMWGWLTLAIMASGSLGLLPGPGDHVQTE